MKIERLLIVGYGSIGKRHVRLARELIPDVKIILLRHSKCDDLQNTDIDICVTSLEEALKHQPQAAIVANPASHHLQVALSLAKAGIHLLIEKPIANTVNGLSELIDICNVNGIILLTGYNLRYLDSLQKFREFIGQNRIGEVFSVRAEIGQYLPSWRPDSDYRKSVSARTELGGGVLLELSHDIDYLCWLFGDVEWVSSVQSKQSHLDVDVEDTAHLILGFENRVGRQPILASLNMDFIRHDTVRSCVVIGETGTLKWNALNGHIEIFEQGKVAWEILYKMKNQRDDSYIAEWKHFLACMAGDDSPFVTGHDGVRVLKVVEAARKSSASSSVVSLNELITT